MGVDIEYVIDTITSNLIKIGILKPDEHGAVEKKGYNTLTGEGVTWDRAAGAVRCPCSARGAACPAGGPRRPLRWPCCACAPRPRRGSCAPRAPTSAACPAHRYILNSFLVDTSNEY